MNGLSAKLHRFLPRLFDALNVAWADRLRPKRLVFVPTLQPSSRPPSAPDGRPPTASAGATPKPAARRPGTSGAGK